MSEDSMYRAQSTISPLSPAKQGRSAYSEAGNASKEELDGMKAYIDRISQEALDIATRISSNVVIVSSGEIQKLAEISRTLTSIRNAIRASGKGNSESANKLDQVLDSLKAAQETLTQDGQAPTPAPCAHGKSIAEQAAALKKLNEALKKMDHQDILSDLAVTTGPLEKANMSDILLPITTPALPPPPKPPGLG